ncbi:MAG: hypothetical protein KGR26_12940 [Cyanobacteria bacterium REEB65]|nr:hypothetical protein [Cyanobacteria bacterium REEB65]
MDIVAIDIERSDGKMFCGTLEYRHELRNGLLLWTAEWRDSQEVTVEFFPGTEFEVGDLVRAHQKVLIDHLLDTLVQRLGRESLFT